jgi:hypothetical protein
LELALQDLGTPVNNAGAKGMAAELILRAENVAKYRMQERSLDHKYQGT